MNLVKRNYQGLFLCLIVGIIAYLISKLIKITSNISILVGVGSSICGGSAIAAPVIGASDVNFSLQWLWVQ